MAHNCKAFQAGILVHACKVSHLLPELQAIIKGFMDTLTQFKRDHKGLASYRQVNLVTELLGEEYEACDAIQSATMLRKLCTKEYQNGFPTGTFFPVEEKLKTVCEDDN